MSGIEGTHRPRSALSRLRRDSLMGVGKNWLSDLLDSIRNLSYNSIERFKKTSSVMRRGWRKSSKDCRGGCSPDAMLGVSAAEV